MKSSELIAQLRKQAEEIATAGHYGWANTMTEAADALERVEGLADACKPITKLEVLRTPSRMLDTDLAVISGETINGIIDALAALGDSHE